jgi:hypothetical protein
LASGREAAFTLNVGHELAERPELESACRNTVAKAMRELGLKTPTL